MRKQFAIVLLTIVLINSVGCTDNSNVTQSSNSIPDESNHLISSSTSDNSTSEPISNDLSPVYVQSTYISPFGNLVYCSDFLAPEDIPGYMLLNWYREYINSTKDPDERKRLYTKDGVTGYIYPAEEFEDYVKQYFNLSSEYMRSNPTFEYNSTHDGYVIIGGGIGEKIELLIDDTASISEKDSIIAIQAQLINSEKVSKGIKELKIQVMPDGSFKYLSYITLG